MNQAGAAPAQADDLLTLIAIGLLSYASADIAHHVIGHGGMCLALGGHILSLSSIHVDCTIRGTAIDLAGPFANLIVGLVMMLASVFATRTARLLLILASTFNVLWFALQLAFSAASRTDDFAWAMTEFHTSDLARFMLIAAGLALYWTTIRIAGRLLSPYGQPAARARRIVWTVWLTAGLFSCVTAFLDHHLIPAILHHAAPQSFGLAIGILFLPQYARGIQDAASPVDFETLWVLSGLAVAAASILFLGPGFSV